IVNTCSVVGIVLEITLSTIWLFFFSSRRRHTRFKCDWSSDVCSSDLEGNRREKKADERRRLVVPGDVPTTEEQGGDEGGHGGHRSEERRVGKESRSRRSGERGEKRGKRGCAT